MGKTSHPFVPGGRYRNRKGDYTVVAIGDKKMTIRYDNGQEQVAKIEKQRHIWHAIQDEIQKEQEEQQAIYDKARRGIQFNGFGEGDFTGDVEGTSWRSQHSLGGLLALQLSEKHGRDFTSYSVYGRPQVFVYPVGLVQEQTYSEMAPVPKLYVTASHTAVTWGLYIEKRDAPMNERWYWPRLLTCLQAERGQEAVARLTAEGMEVMLHLEKRERADSEVYKTVGRTTTLAQLVTEMDAPPLEVLYRYLTQLPDDVWCNFYIRRAMWKEKAIAAEVEIAKEIGRTFNELLPFYLALLR